MATSEGICCAAACRANASCRASALGTVKHHVTVPDTATTIAFSDCSSR